MPLYADIQKLFVQKQNALSQFNENTLVKGVSLFLFLFCLVVFVLTLPLQTGDGLIGGG